MAGLAHGFRPRHGLPYTYQPPGVGIPQPFGVPRSGGAQAGAGMDMGQPSPGVNPFVKDPGMDFNPQQAQRNMADIAAGNAPGGQFPQVPGIQPSDPTYTTAQYGGTVHYGGGGKDGRFRLPYDPARLPPKAKLPYRRDSSYAASGDETRPSSLSNTKASQSLSRYRPFNAFNYRF